MRTRASPDAYPCEPRDAPRDRAPHRLAALHCSLSRRTTRQPPWQGRTLPGRLCGSGPARPDATRRTRASLVVLRAIAPPLLPRVVLQPCIGAPTLQPGAARQGSLHGKVGTPASPPPTHRVLDAQVVVMFRAAGPECALRLSPRHAAACVPPLAARSDQHQLPAPPALTATARRSARENLSSEGSETGATPLLPSAAGLSCLSFSLGPPPSTQDNPSLFILP